MDIEARSIPYLVLSFKVELRKCERVSDNRGEPVVVVGRWAVRRDFRICCVTADYSMWGRSSYV